MSKEIFFYCSVVCEQKYLYPLQTGNYNTEKNNEQKEILNCTVLD